MSRDAIKQLVEGNAAAMNETIKTALSQKAADKLEEMKQAIGNSYFGKK